MIIKSVITNHSIASTFLEKIFIYRMLRPETVLDEEVDLLLVHDGDDYLKLGRIQEQFEQDLQNGRAEKCCFILLPPGSSEDRWNYYHSEGNLQKAYRRFIYEELLPELEKKFTIRKLGMLGDSLAGAVSFRLALYHLERWTHILLQSAAFSEKDVKRGGNLQKSLPWIIYQSVGTKEDDFISPITQEQLYILTRNRQIKASIRAKHHTYIENIHGHLWECWRESLSSAVKIFYQS